MMRSLFSGVTGLRSHQTRMDVIGNNIANVNTVGFKKSTVTFKDLYSETISAAASASGTGAATTGGVNARQIGLGSAVNSINVVHTAGSAQYTGNGMDVAISGDGYFIVQTPTGNKYTRAGNFTTDLLGNLVSADGYYLQTVPALREAVEIYSLEDIGASHMVARSIDYPSGGDIHSGTPTADLGELEGKTFMFQYKPEGWTAQMTTGGYFPTLSLADDGTGVQVHGVNNGAAANWSSTDIEQLVTAALGDDSSAGVQDLEFQWDADNGEIQLTVGDLVLGSVQWTDLGTGNEAQIQFGTLETMVITNESGEDLTGEDLVGMLNNAKGRPAINMEEQGKWVMVNKDNPAEVIDTVTVAATAASGGGYMGEFRIMTTEMGQFTLKLTQPVANMQQLSEELSDSSFSPEISMEWGVNYSSPSTVLESGLQTLTVDFDLYSSLAIDKNGAIIAQLAKDQQITVDGQTINLKMGDKVVLGYVPLANFNNPSGLEKIGDNLYDVSANSGDPNIGMPGTGNAGSLSPSNLEMSNVDLSEEIVNMIITQRGFQANSRIITTTDTMLEELVNLKR